MQESNLVFGLVVGLEEISGLKLEGLEKVIGSVLRPFHQIQIVVDVWAIGMNQALGCEACQILWLAFGLHHQALFRS